MRGDFFGIIRGQAWLCDIDWIYAAAETGITIYLGSSLQPDRAVLKWSAVGGVVPSNVPGIFDQEISG